MKKYLKNISAILIYIFFDTIFYLITKLINIDYNSFNNLKKTIYLIINGLFMIFILIFIYKDELKKDFNDYKKNFKLYFDKYFKVYVFGVLLMGISNTIISKFTHMEISENEEIIRNLVDTMPIYITFSTVLYAPLIEELIYRKCIRNLISNDIAFIYMSGLIFGLMHVVSGHETVNDILMGIPYIIIGIDFAFIYYKTKNIFSTIQFHFLHNLLLLIIQFI